MSKRVSNEEFWKMVGFVKGSTIRYETLKCLETGILIPKDIASKTELTPNKVSRALRDLKEMNLVICMNEESRKGRLYRKTELGTDILDVIDKNKPK